MRVKDIYDFIESFAPFETAMDFDNCGLLVGSLDRQVNKMMITLDVTHEVIKEAEENNVDLILSHHPVIFKPLKKLRSDEVPYLLARKGIDVICAHTNLDMANGGVNICLANKLELKNIRPLSIYKETKFNKIAVFAPSGYENKIIESMAEEGAGTLGNYSKCSFKSRGIGGFFCEEGSDPFIGDRGKYEETDEIKIEMICEEKKTECAINAMLKVHPYETPAYDVFEDKALKNVLPLGLVGELNDVMTSEEFARYVKEKLNCKGVRYTNRNDKIKTVALCSGAGGSMVSDVIKLGVDAFVTGEIKHNEILDLNLKGITLVDAGHFKTENVYVDYMIKMVEKNFCDLIVIKSQMCSDHINYV